MTIFMPVFPFCAHSQYFADPREAPLSRGRLIMTHPVCQCTRGSVRHRNGHKMLQRSEKLGRMAQ